MTARLDQIIDTFASVDDELRLELLLDYAKKLPPLPERFYDRRDAGFNRVDECMTPVFLFVEKNGGVVRLFVDVAEEAPTVRGMLSIIISVCDGATAEEVAALPLDLLNRLRLHKQIRMNRTIGLSAIVSRIRREAAALVDKSAVET